MVRLCFAILLIITCTACSSVGFSSSIFLPAQGAMALCIDEIEGLTKKELSADIDHVYIDVFLGGYTLSFSDGAIGSFGKRSHRTRTVWACAVTQNKVVYLGAPLRDALIDMMDSYSFENYEEDVEELLFKRGDNGFEYCCSQAFDEKNIEKNNPGFPWETNTVN